MTKPKKRPSKTAKAAKKILEESKLLEATRGTTNAGQEFRSQQVTPRTNSIAIKPRPEKKKG